jgi:dihydropteroate synthase
MSDRATFSVPLPGRPPLVLGHRTLIMGVINVTPDSFADGGVRVDPDVAILDALRMVDAGADLIDIGGESTRPGAAALVAEDEWRRVAPVLEGLRGRAAVPLSIDTYKAEVAARAIDLGVSIVNDISGLSYDPGLAEVVARADAAVVLTHNRGRSRDMYGLADYDDVASEVRAELAGTIDRAVGAGIRRDRILVDPGIGFAKRAGQSLSMLADLPALATLGRPILVGPSRKSYLTGPLGSVPAAERAWGTAAAVTAAILHGAHIVRVHDVPEMVQVARVADAIVDARRGRPVTREEP